MIDRTRTSDEPVGAEGHGNGAALERRVRRLEDAVASLQDTRQLEDRVVERLSRLQPAPAAPAREANTGRLILEATRRLLPAPAVEVVPNPADAAPRSPASLPAPRSVWFLYDTYLELRVLLRMFVDPRYRLTWTTRTVPLFLLAAMFLPGLWVPGASLINNSPMLYWWVYTGVNLVLGYFLFKILTREALRYRQTAADLPASLRL
jgi:hypothetical protein